MSESDSDGPSGHGKPRSGESPARTPGPPGLRLVTRDRHGDRDSLTRPRPRQLAVEARVQTSSFQVDVSSLGCRSPRQGGDWNPSRSSSLELYDHDASVFHGRSRSESCRLLPGGSHAAACH